MYVEKFLAHIADNSPTFKCYACGDKQESLNLTAQLAHTRNSPATGDELKQLRDWLTSHAEDFVVLYSQHNGLIIYEDTAGDAAGIMLYPVANWPDKTEEMKSQFEAMGVEQDDQPAGVIDSLAFGEIPHSANYFTVKLSGPHAGKIFYADHDDFSDDPFADSFADFLARVVNDPTKFLYDVGCYTRYSDGKTSTQWIPKEYGNSSA
ncbi:SMI1/KNR4 family protein [uncultured Rubinisphaera sp.]|uniref:SMI1/KNR4 family protein n=1 Tax=uncultured Rubinisphaera sp. TaxID=1678686 RepID=UPI0030DA2475